MVPQSGPQSKICHGAGGWFYTGLIRLSVGFVIALQGVFGLLSGICTVLMWFLTWLSQALFYADLQKFRESCQVRVDLDPITPWCFSQEQPLTERCD